MDVYRATRQHLGRRQQAQRPGQQTQGLDRNGGGGGGGGHHGGHHGHHNKRKPRTTTVSSTSYDWTQDPVYQTYLGRLAPDQAAAAKAASVAAGQESYLGGVDPNAAPMWGGYGNGLATPDTVPPPVVTSSQVPVAQKRGGHGGHHGGHHGRRR